jgi:hypothetical protein
VVRGEEGKGWWRRASAARPAEYYPSVRAPQVLFDRYDRRMRIGRLALGGLAVLSGLVWMAQGLNLPFAPRSFMTADRAWIVLGAATVLGGVVLLARALRRA